MRTGLRVVLAALLVFGSLGGAAADCRGWLALLPQDIDDMQGLEASVAPAGQDKPEAACTARRDYVGSTSHRKASITILQGMDSRRWIAYDLKTLLVVGKAPSCTWETVSGHKTMLHLGTRRADQPAASSLLFSPKEGFLLELEVESPDGQPAPTKEDMLRLGALLPLGKFAAACAKIS
ncbi:MAG: hypothetical protein A2W03_07305 [Candidatus Aminicenantes bacterium RBG_16_63_16]|nr:MAG: hypothetical protein A2W03_07305 [Candidatus Aminicenantes bacterium RBG_16_63_16]